MASSTNVVLVGLCSNFRCRTPRPSSKSVSRRNCAAFFAMFVHYITMHMPSRVVGVLWITKKISKIVCTSLDNAHTYANLILKNTGGRHNDRNR